MHVLYFYCEIKPFIHGRKHLSFPGTSLLTTQPLSHLLFMMVCDTPQKGKSVTNLLATDWLGNKDMFGAIRIDSRTAARILNKQIITVNKEINKDTYYVLCWFYLWAQLKPCGLVSSLNHISTIIQKCVSVTSFIYLFWWRGIYNLGYNWYSFSEFVTSCMKWQMSKHIKGKNDMIPQITDLKWPSIYKNIWKDFYKYILISF